MYRISTKTVAGGDWLTLGEASRLLGVDPDTLRRWADNGKIDVFTTPGGHRRFLRASIDAMLPRPRQARRQSLTALDSLRWFRERGMRMSELLLGHLDTTRRAGRDQLIEQASLLGREYGVEAKRRGLSLGEATQAFLFFRARFMAEIAQVARRRALASEQASLLFEEADRALDRVILALIQGHQA
ncbi:MAG: helix-turn-helix domain-containing protein [Chloroflexi bacterium]|nr:MAG: helix-turn-helix domain-containing protein [Chloroflexota bacterium]